MPYNEWNNMFVIIFVVRRFLISMFSSAFFVWQFIKLVSSFCAKWRSSIRSDRIETSHVHVNGWTWALRFDRSPSIKLAAAARNEKREKNKISSSDCSSRHIVIVARDCFVSHRLNYYSLIINIIHALGWKAPSVSERSIGGTMLTLTERCLRRTRTVLRFNFNFLFLFS